VNPFRWSLLALVVVASLIGVAVALHPSASDPTTAATGLGASTTDPTAGGLLIADTDRVAAPDFTGIDSWLNGPPLTIPALRGKVVLVDFWTFSCVNCTRTIPHLQTLETTYRSAGLVLVGVHSPEFDFEKSRDNVAAATRRLGVSWPVALDSEMATWNAYGNQYWPAEYLIDQNGRVAYVHFGEGDYSATETAVRALLHATATPGPATDVAPGRDITPELYAGSQRGHLADGAAYGSSGQAVNYPDHGAPVERDAIAVVGRWVDRGDYLDAVGAGHIRLRFHASEVYVVAGVATNGNPLRVGVTLDGGPVAAGNRGPDLSDGSMVVSSAGLDHVLTGVAPGDHVIDLSVPAGLSLYTFTFG
jgi:thiol-disulfide isomerase/thioredoxin